MFWPSLLSTCMNIRNAVSCFQRKLKTIVIIGCRIDVINRFLHNLWDYAKTLRSCPWSGEMTLWVIWWRQSDWWLGTSLNNRNLIWSFKACIRFLCYLIKENHSRLCFFWWKASCTIWSKPNLFLSITRQYFRIQKMFGAQYSFCILCGIIR